MQRTAAHVENLAEETAAQAVAEFKATGSAWRDAAARAAARSDEAGDRFDQACKLVETCCVVLTIAALAAIVVDVMRTGRRPA